MDKTFFYSVLNFVIFTGLMFYYLRTPVKGFISARHESLRDDLSKVREQLRSAQEKYEEFSAKLKAIDVEVSNIREISKKDAAGLQAKIVSSAKQMSGSILAESKARATALVSECKESLRSELGLRIVSRAQELIQERMTGDDKARIRKEFSERVGSAS